MAGDTGIREGVVVLEATPAAAAEAAVAVREGGGRILHHFGPRLAIAELPQGAEGGVRSALPNGEVKIRAAAVSDVAAAGLDPVGALGLEAFRLRQSAAFTAAKAARPRAGEPWDTEGASPPEPPGAGTDAHFPDERPTSARLIGSVAVGLVIVEGPGALTFSAAERTKVVAEVQNGLTWLGTRRSNANVSWSFDIQIVTLTVAPDASLTDVEALEAHWRDPALRSMGFMSGLAGAFEYIEHLRRVLETQWAYCGFFTKYPTGWFGYAAIGGPRIVLQYANDGWGPDNIDRVFAHETGHIFGAPDEYASSGCTCAGAWGLFGQPNRNCENCAAGGSVPCIMRSNDWAICPFTPAHLGWGSEPGDLGDYDGDGKTDFAVWRAKAKAFYVVDSSTGSTRSEPVGAQGDVPVPGDYDGDGKTDFAVWRPTDGTWRGPGGEMFPHHPLGQSGDLPVPGDYDGDGKTDRAVWRPSNGTWYVLPSSSFLVQTRQWGQSGDVPVPGDYDGDGKTDFAVWRPANGRWYVVDSSSGATRQYQWGQTGDVPVPGDYDGDGKTDFAVWRPGDGRWYVVESSTSGIRVFKWGQHGDLPVPGDYDGDARTDFAVWRPSNGRWYLAESSTGATRSRKWGATTDLPAVRAGGHP